MARGYFKQVLIAVDQLVNTLFSGYADETLSSRAHRMRVKNHKYWKWTASFIDVLFFWDPNHCETSFHSERSRMQLPPEMRE